jgi:hypothetical protein
LQFARRGPPPLAIDPDAAQSGGLCGSTRIVAPYRDESFAGILANGWTGLSGLSDCEKAIEEAWVMCGVPIWMPCKSHARLLSREPLC